MPFTLGNLGSVFGGVGSLGGSIAGGASPANSKTTTSGTSSSTTSGTGSFNTNPVFDPETENLRKTLISSLLGNLGSDTDMSGYLSGALQQNNAGFDAAKTALGQTLAQRGLTYSPVAGTSMANLDTQRIGSGVNIANQVPLLKQQLYQQKLQQALQGFSAMPYGQAGNQTQNQQQDTSMNQNSSTTYDQPDGLFGSIFKGIGSLAGIIPGL